MLPRPAARTERDGDSDVVPIDGYRGQHHRSEADSSEAGSVVLVDPPLDDLAVVDIRAAPAVEIADHEPAAADLQAAAVAKNASFHQPDGTVVRRAEQVIAAGKVDRRTAALDPPVNRKQ